MAIQIENIECPPNSTMLIHFTQNTDLSTMNKITSYLQEIFPNNQVISANDYYIEKISILDSSKQDKYLWDL